MRVLPLLFSALVIGVAEMGDIGSLGRVGWKTLAYTVLVSGIGVVIALTLVNLLRPGDGIDPEFARTMLASAGDGAKAIVSTRSDERRVGQECDSKGRSRWAP